MSTTMTTESQWPHPTKYQYQNRESPPSPLSPVSGVSQALYSPSTSASVITPSFLVEGSLVVSPCWFLGVLCLIIDQPGYPLRSLLLHELNLTHWFFIRLSPWWSHERFVTYIVENQFIGNSKHFQNFYYIFKTSPNSIWSQNDSVS